MEMCRACLSTEQEMITADELFIYNYNLLTNLNVVFEGELHQFCQTCVKAVDFFMIFREKCIVAENKLRQVLLEQISVDKRQLNTDNECIKVEVKEEKVTEEEVITYDYVEESFQEFQDVIVKKEEVKPIRVKQKKLTLSQKIQALIKPEEFPCGLCKNCYTKKNDLNKHLEDHKKGNHCGICKETFTIWPPLLAHRLTHVPIKYHRCHICNKSCRSLYSMEHHYNTNHYEGENPRLTCKYCLRSYNTPLGIKKHVLRSHVPRTFICDHCDKVFNNKQSIKSHLKVHFETKAYVCNFCEFSCKYQGGLKDHVTRKHSLIKVKCKNCDRLFQSQETHDKHKCSSTIMKICPICGRQIAKSRAFRKHMESHSARRMKCPRCPATYKSRTALADHLRRHDGNRTKQCEYCPLKFYSGSVLIKHRRVHTGEKPYICKICKKGFTGNYNLKVHMKVHGLQLVKKTNESNDIISPEIFSF